MRRPKHLANLILFILIITAQADSQSTTQLFDRDWKFILGGFQGSENPDFNDASWRKLDLPHDWSIENLAGKSTPFDSLAVSQVSGGFTTGGTAWYRKHFSLSQAASGKQILVQFDGVYMNADIWVNGNHVGNHPYGYTSFIIDISKEVKTGESNLIAVQVKNAGENSRWYSGSGIYRHVWLKILEPVHFDQWGVFISTPKINTDSAEIVIQSSLKNESNANADITLVTTILDQSGKGVFSNQMKESISANSEKQIHNLFSIKKPQLWSCEKPNLYRAQISIYQGDKLLGSEETRFGIRSISFDANKGFQLNGVSLKLKGGCFHNDNGALGSAAYDRAEERKVEILKANGYNAIRCSHNPPSPAFLGACDSLGMLVMDEAFDMWNYGKTPFDYHLYFKDWWQRDVSSMVLRDRNHPSVIMWSIGNEIPERATPEGVQTARTIVAFIRNLDKTRAITSAVNDLKPDKDPYFAELDLAGYNYAAMGITDQKNVYELDHTRVPNRIMLGTESYPLTAFEAWMDVTDHPYVIGDFVWTAWDYIGEASIGWLGYPQSYDCYPWNLAFCGDIDICGWKRPQSFYRDALWTNNQLSIFVKPPTPSFSENQKLEYWSKWNWRDAVADWNWTGFENKPMQVEIYSSCEKVELFLNNKSLGIQNTNRSTKFMAVWNLPYQAGELKAIGYSGNKIVKTEFLRTAGEPKKIELSADRVKLKADGQDLSFITIELKDSKGILNPKAENLLQFSIEGNGTLVGVANANPRSLESFQNPQRKCWKGKCQVIIKAGAKPGKIILKVQSNGLPQSNLEIAVE